ncbi:hypothetical protein DPMN_015404 [Dreissena polymorpha]|uniref:Uncharacterized protein n=1 Tax=Dreissena polymorpha TaxID=45954 RepID=A0A9D4NBF6_DREPO|nr:hypothetical protein DPMN_015404 [Dreissena polymorpha]
MFIYVDVANMTRVLRELVVWLTCHFKVMPVFVVSLADLEASDRVGRPGTTPVAYGIRLIFE